MRENLNNIDFSRFNAINPRLLEVVDNMLATDIVCLMAQIPKEETNAVKETGGDHLILNDAEVLRVKVSVF